MTRLRARHMRGQEESVNPMDGLGNLADAMLVLAVGIMLALILNWKVDITTPGGAAVPEPESQSQSVALDESALEDADRQDMDARDLQKIGGLYYDEETGMYYAVMGEDE